MARKKIKSRVILVASDANGKPVEQFKLSYEMYYEDGVPVIDSNSYRAAKGIRFLNGMIYNSKGSLQQSFDNEYAADGVYVKQRAVFADGTVVED